MTLLAIISTKSLTQTIGGDVYTTSVKSTGLETNLCDILPVIVYTAMKLHKFCRRSCQNPSKLLQNLCKTCKIQFPHKTCDGTYICAKPAAVPALDHLLQQLLRKKSWHCLKTLETYCKTFNMPKNHWNILSAIPVIALPAPKPAKPALLTQNLLQILRLTHLCSSCSEAPCKFRIQYCMFCTVQRAIFWRHFFINHTSQKHIKLICMYGVFAI